MDAAPYQPPSLRSHEFRQPEGSHVRPWMLKRDGETVPEWARRTHHTCWRCGVQLADMRALDAHEAGHDRSKGR